MTNDPTTNQKNSRKSIDSSSIEDYASTRRSKQIFLPTRYISSINLMNFVEIKDINSITTPSERSGHRAVATDSDFWIWGGYRPSVNRLDGILFNELWRFNYALQRWTRETYTGNAPNGTPASHSMCLHRHLVFVFGGTGFPFAHRVSNNLDVLNLKQLHWKRCELTNQPLDQAYGASMVIKDNHLYILCGLNQFHYNTDVYDIHLSTMKCTKIGETFLELEEDTENGRYRQEVCIYNNKIFVFGGGGNTGIAFSLENLPVFDIDARTWSFVHTNPDPVHNFPKARKFHSIFSFRKNQAIMFGGAYYNASNPSTVPVDGHLWIFDFDKLEWSMLQSLSMIQPTYFHAAAMNERGEIWMHGGVVYDPDEFFNERRTSNLYRMCSRVLNLSEIAWNFFLNCLSDRTVLERHPDVMTRLHIPARFIERIH